MAIRPHTAAKQTVSAFIHECRTAGWRQVSIDMKPDGTVRINANMGEEGSLEDFDVPNMRMGRK